jgi:hypothetical protein
LALQQQKQTLNLWISRKKKLKWNSIRSAQKIPNKCLFFSPYLADKCFSKFLFQDQFRAFVNVKYKWFVDRMVTKIGLHRNRWIENLDRRSTVGLVGIGVPNNLFILNH